ncbi:MAG: hypothetical protein ACLVJH_15330 [Faecalibacterium prausnitzii]
MKFEPQRSWPPVRCTAGCAGMRHRAAGLPQPVCPLNAAERRSHCPGSRLCPPESIATGSLLCQHDCWVLLQQLSPWSFCPPSYSTRLRGNFYVRRQHRRERDVCSGVAQAVGVGTATVIASSRQP